jgi:hypothetical protein
VAPVVIGEFGGRSVGDDSEGTWQRALIDYADQNGIGWLNWSFNPDSSDTGGLLSDDWLSVVQSKLDLYRGHLAAPLDVGSSGVFGVAQPRLSVRGKSTSTGAQTNNVGFLVQIVNNSATPVNLSDLELRYWMKADTPAATATATPVAKTKITEQVDIDYAAVGAGNVKAQVSQPDQSGLVTVRLFFAAGAGSIKPYASSGDVAVRVHKSDWSNFNQSGNFSFRSNAQLADWDHVGLYRGGALVWGTEP